jgi:hypothetical protein
VSRRRDPALASWREELTDFRDEFPERLRRNMDEVMQVFSENLRESMPVRTGALKASGSWDSDLSEHDYSAAVTFGGIAAPYAPYVVGRFVNGEHPWDDVLPEHEAVFDAAISEALHGD